MTSTRAGRGSESTGPSAASAEAHQVTCTPPKGDGFGEVVAREFARLGQRDLRAPEQAIAQGVFEGVDQWASGHDPEALPTLAVALASALASLPETRPLLFLSPEAELLRMRQVRFGARAASRLVDVQSASFEGSLPSSGVIWCTLESLQTANVRDALRAVAPAAIFVESAHAASPLAHEMRPSLALVPGLRSACGDPPLVAFTRAAPLVVQGDASARLGLSAPRTQLLTPAAPTRISVVPTSAGSLGESGQAWIEEVERLPRPTIVFCPTSEEADAVFARLVVAQIPVHRYHGAMSETERATEMLHFTLPGRRAVMVATSAFRPGSGLAGIEAGRSAMTDGLGLGYCKQKARSLMHSAPPLSLEQYALELSVLQEDEETESVLFCNARELAVQWSWLERMRLEPRHLVDLAGCLRGADAPLDLHELQRRTGWGRHVVERALRLFQDVGVVTRGEQGAQANVSGETLLQVTHLLTSALSQMREADRHRLEAMERFLAHDGCRRRFLDGYLGVEAELRDCGRCDVCASVGAKTARSTDLSERTSSHPEAESERFRRRAPARSWSAGAPQAEAPAVVVHKTRRQRRAVVS